MKRRINFLFAVVIMLSAGVSLGGEDLELKASKDTFVRSSEHANNNGASPTLYVAYAPNFRALVAFDLEGVTNRILKATFRFQQQESMSDPISLTVAPLAQTKNNTAWGEGGASVGAIGVNAQPGESCYGWSAFPDVKWEGPSGRAVQSVGNPKIWEAPLISKQRMAWKKGEWVQIDVENIQLLEDIRLSENPVLTLGMWGTDGNGLYPISSKESGSAAQLILEIEEEKDTSK